MESKKERRKDLAKQYVKIMNTIEALSKIETSNVVCILRAVKHLERAAREINEVYIETIYEQESEVAKQTLVLSGVKEIIKVEKE